MALHTTKTFELDNTIYFECGYRTTMGVSVDPDNPAWKITTRKGTAVDDSVASGGPYKRSTGLWYIFWTSDQVGDYALEFTGEIDGKAVKTRRLFKIIKTTAIY